MQTPISPIVSQPSAPSRRGAPRQRPATTRRFGRGFAALLCASMLVPAAAHADEKYTMEDLVALDESSDWGELIKHLEDVRPSKRKAQWKAMAERAAIGRVDEFVKRNEKQQAYAEAERILLEVTVLKKSRKFLDKRSEVGLTMFKDCLSHRGGKPCVDGLKGLVNTDPTNAKLAFEAGKAVRLGFNAGSALPFFAGTLKKNDKRCSDGDVILSVKNGLAQPPGDWVGMAADIAFGRCAKAHKEATKKVFLSGSPTGYSFRNMCPLMKKAKRLSKFQKAVCDDVKEKK